MSPLWAQKCSAYVLSHRSFCRRNFHRDRNRAPTGIGALPSLQSLVANLSDAILLERRKPRGVDRGFPRIGLGSAEQRRPVREVQVRTETASWMWDLPLLERRPMHPSPVLENGGSLGEGVTEASPRIERGSATLGACPSATVTLRDVELWRCEFCHSRPATILHPIESSLRSENEGRAKRGSPGK